MRSLGCALVWHGWCPCKKRLCERRHMQRKDHGGCREGWTPISQGEFRGETRPTNSLLPDVQPPEFWDVLSSSPPVWDTVLCWPGPSLLTVFITSRCWILSNDFSAFCQKHFLSKCFFTSIDMIMWFFYLNLSVWWITLVDFWMFN